MNPTLVEPMILETEPADCCNLGDVVVFIDRNKKAIVHRIVKQNISGFITRGDNNLTDDEPIVKQDILGKVVAACRGEQRYRVSGGKYGYLLHRFLQVRKIFLSYFIKLLSFWYRLFSGSGFFIKLLPQKNKPKIIQYQNGQAHLYIGRIFAGRYDVRLSRWIIFRPWRIFVDEKSLPLPKQVFTNQGKENLLNISRIIDSENTLIPVLTPEAWNDLFELAEKQGVACYLYYALKQKKSEDVIPEEWLRKIRIQLMRFSINNIKHLNELEELSLLFEKIGITAIFLKGSHLAFHVYPSPSLRPMDDIDIIVKEDDIPKISAALIESGYCNDYYTLENIKKYHRHLPPFTKKGKRCIELHWTLMQPMFQTPETEKTLMWMIGETEEKTYGKGRALVFRPNAVIFQLMLHIGLNDYISPSLKNLLDITVLIQKHQHEINWEVISAKILETCFVHRFALLGWLAKNTVGAKIPEYFFQTLNAETGEEIKEIALNRIINFRDLNLTNNHPTLLSANLFKKLFIMLSTVFISPSEMRYWYNLKTNWEAFLFYPKRFFDFTRRHKSDVLKTLRPDNTLISKMKEELEFRVWLDNWDFTNNSARRKGN